MICPIRKEESRYGEENEYSGVFVDADCVAEKCAWWAGGRCAILRIADALFSMDEYGIRPVSHT